MENKFNKALAFPQQEMNAKAFEKSKKEAGKIAAGLEKWVI